MKQLSDTMRSYVVLAFIYLALNIALPANRAASKEYNLSSAHYHLLLLAVVVPQTLVWLAAFYGYAQLKRYATAIKETPDGVSFNRLANGFRWLAWGLAVPAIISTIINAVVDAHPGFKASGVIIANYIALLVPVVAFTILSKGSRLLSNHARIRITGKALRILIALFVLLGVIYCYLTFRQLDLKNTTSTDNPFYLPTWLMVLTITIPYLYAWFTGLLAAYEIGLVGRKTAGIFYRKSLQILAVGITLVIAGSITLQYITSIEPRKLHFSLGGLLLITYTFRVIAGVGYLVMARGANRLRKIEEV